MAALMRDVLLGEDRKWSAEGRADAVDPERTSALRQPGDPHPFIDDAFDLGAWKE